MVMPFILFFYKGKYFVCHIEITQTMVPFVTLWYYWKTFNELGALNWFHNVSTNVGQTSKLSKDINSSIHMGMKTLDQCALILEKMDEIPRFFIESQNL
jgi:hypothetical protein